MGCITAIFLAVIGFLVAGPVGSIIFLLGGLLVAVGKR